MNLSTVLLRWYDVGARDLPWRTRPSPYRTLVSEFMLQQTVVATVIPYFHSFVERFPDFAALARAGEQDVLGLWSGLGYYTRARNLHRAAVAVVEEHGGALPRDEATLVTLPGVGPYTAAAVAAIAFGAQTFALDGNAARVVARLFAVAEPIDGPAARLRLRARGQTLVPRLRAGDFAQAVMELGARVCVAGRPRCASCPVIAHCRAQATDRTDVIPVRRVRAPKKIVRVACIAVERAGKILLELRPAGSLLGGTWTLPAAEVDAGESEPAAARRALSALGLRRVGALRELGSVRHVFTHRDVTASAFQVKATGRPTGSSELRWVNGRDLVSLAVSSFTRKTLGLLRDAPVRAAS